MSIRIPKRLKKRPQFKGLPIPYIALIDENGKPDFRVTDEAKRIGVIRNRHCQLCDEPLGKYCFFVGGTEAAKANMYFEPGTHLDCLIYAMKVCPFIVGKIEHVDLDKIQKQYLDKALIARKGTGDYGTVMVKADSNFASVRNPWWVIKKASDWGYARTPDGTILLVPEVVKQTEPLHAETMSSEDWTKVYKELMQ